MNRQEINENGDLANLAHKFIKQIGGTKTALEIITASEGFLSCNWSVYGKTRVEYFGRVAKVDSSKIKTSWLSMEKETRDKLALGLSRACVKAVNVLAINNRY